MVGIATRSMIRWVVLLAIVIWFCILLHRFNWFIRQHRASKPHGFDATVLAISWTHDPANAVAQVRHLVTSYPKMEAVRLIRKFLGTGQDVRTGLGFVLAADGSLRQAPTLRTLLLDMLGKLAPEQAAQVAKGILEKRNSPDEWAVSLAIYARADSSDSARPFLQEKAEQMALDESWQKNPSSGFLEAFDLFVYTHDTNFVPDLARMTNNKDNRAVAHAAFLALDRLVQSDPIPTLQILLDQPQLMAGHEPTLAAYLARADPRDPGQQQLLSRYLLSPNLSLAELEAFVGLFPNENFFVSNNLLTQSPAVSNQEVVSRYDAAWQLIKKWQSDAQFEALRPQLNQIIRRISRIRGG